MFRFTIRDMLWLTAVVSVLTTWGTDRIQLQRTIEALEFKSNWVPIVPHPFSRIDASGEPMSPDNARAMRVDLALEKLSNAEIEWRGTTFGHAGPAIKGENARQILGEGVGISAKLIPLLDDPESFVAAHVLLTEMWRVPDGDKNRHSRATSTGYAIDYNGLELSLDWTEVAGQITKKATVPDAAAQAKRLSRWWSERLQAHPQEFSPSTAVE